MHAALGRQAEEPARVVAVVGGRHPGGAPRHAVLVARKVAVLLDRGSDALVVERDLAGSPSVVDLGQLQPGLGEIGHIGRARGLRGDHDVLLEAVRARVEDLRAGRLLEVGEDLLQPAGLGAGGRAGDRDRPARDVVRVGEPLQAVPGEGAPPDRMNEILRGGGGARDGARENRDEPPMKPGCRSFLIVSGSRHGTGRAARQACRRGGSAPLHLRRVRAQRWRGPASSAKLSCPVRGRRTIADVPMRLEDACRDRRLAAGRRGGGRTTRARWGGRPGRARPDRPSGAPTGSAKDPHRRGRVERHPGRATASVGRRRIARSPPARASPERTRRDRPAHVPAYGIRRAKAARTHRCSHPRAFRPPAGSW